MADRRRGARVRGPARQLRGPLRPAAVADRQAQARHHRGRPVPGDRRVHRLRQGRGQGLGPRADHVVPARGVHPARPQGRPAAAAGRRRGRGGPGPARGPRPALRPAHAVPRVQAGRRGARAAARRRVDATPAAGRARGPLRHPAARGAHRDRARRVRPPRRQGAGAQAGARGVPAAHPRRQGQRPRAGGAGGRPAAAQRHDDLPRALRGLAGQAHHRGAVPVAARAVPRGRRRLRPGDPAGRADRPLDRGPRTATWTITDEFDGADPEAADPETPATPEIPDANDPQETP